MVLESIRKNGAYIGGQEDPEMSPEELMARALIAAQKVIEEKQRLLKEGTGVPPKDTPLAHPIESIDFIESTRPSSRRWPSSFPIWNAG